VRKGRAQKKTKNNSLSLWKVLVLVLGVSGRKQGEEKHIYERGLSKEGPKNLPRKEGGKRKSTEETSKILPIFGDLWELAS